MIEPPITLRATQGGTRAYPFLADILTFYALAIQGMRGDFYEGDPPNVVMACMAGNCDLAISLEGFLAAAETCIVPETIDIHVTPRRPEPADYNGNGIKSLNGRITAAMFALLVERANDWVRYNVSTNYAAWPPVSNFSRVVRAIVHGGTINIQNQTQPPVSWRGVSYDYRDYGKVVLNTGVLSVGDLILLMIEVEQEITALGAPFDLQ
jgi:hypothetical protein